MSSKPWVWTGEVWAATQATREMMGPILATMTPLDTGLSGQAPAGTFLVRLAQGEGGMRYQHSAQRWADAQLAGGRDVLMSTRTSELWATPTAMRDAVVGNASPGADPPWCVLYMAKNENERFRDALVERARADIGRVIEQPGNIGKEIAEYLRAVGEKPGKNWCSAALSAWVRDAAIAAGVAAPFAGTAGARYTMTLARKARGALWVPGAEVSPLTCPPGTIITWDTSRADDSSPESYWWGHNGVLESWTTGSDGKPRFVTIEGNAGPYGVTRETHDPAVESGPGWWSKLLGGVVLE